MSVTKKAAIYARVSTDSQTTENQTRELEAYAARMIVSNAHSLLDKAVGCLSGCFLCD